MRKLLIIAYVVALGGVVGAQDVKVEATQADPAPDVTKIVRLKYATPHVILGLLLDAQVHLREDDSMRVIILRGSPSRVAAAEQTIRDLDVPSTEPNSKDVEVVVSVIYGSNKPDAMSEGQITADLAPVVKQLRAVFPYKAYQMLGSIMLRSLAGSASENRGVMKNLGDVTEAPVQYFLHYEKPEISSEGGKPLIRLQGFEFNVPVRFVVGSASMRQVLERQVQIKTAVDLREGQKVVVGTANVENNDSAVFVVLSARLVD